MSGHRHTHKDAMEEALACERRAHQLLLAGEPAAAQQAFAEAAACYRASWQLAAPTSYGRLVGMLKAAVLAGGGAEEADYASTQLADAAAGSPTAAYARAIAALVRDDDATACREAATMGAGGDAFARAGAAIDALARRDGAAYAEAIAGIVRDFESRSRHLTDVAIADTALMLERLAGRRSLSSGVVSPLLPASS